MYEDLIKRLRVTCGSCKLWDGYKCCLKGECSAQTRLQAADAIEELNILANNGEATYDIMVRQTSYIEKLKQKIPHWIPVTERLPEPKFARDWYLVSLESGCVKSLAFEKEEGWHETGSPVTHWMPLPEPPKEET